jgi:hypothetical protein
MYSYGYKPHLTAVFVRELWSASWHYLLGTQQVNPPSSSKQFFGIGIFAGEGLVYE